MSGIRFLSVLVAAVLVAFPFGKAGWPGSAAFSPIGGAHVFPDAPVNVSLTGKTDGAVAGLPLAFEPNRGQADPRVRFLARRPGSTLFLTSSEVVLVVRPAAQASTTLRMTLIAANPRPQVAAVDVLPGTVNYFMGRDPARWRTNVPTYARVVYKAIYPGIDLVFDGRRQQLEYDFVIAPGADPSAIELAFQGHRELEVDARGDLVLHTAGGIIRHRRPVVYQQEEDGRRRTVAGAYVAKGRDRVAFRIGAYDPTRPLVIDPVLTYSTYLGGSGSDSARAIAIDGSGNVYVTGSTTSANFPTVNALQPAIRGFGDVFVSKLNAAGTALMYSTYLGGAAGDVGHGIAVDGAGNVYVTGATTSANFPTAKPFQATFGGTDDAFVTKLGPTGSTLVYSSFLGGNNTDVGHQISVDASGNAYVTGQTLSSNFPTTAGVFQRTCTGFFCSDAFVTKIASTGTLSLSTFLGGTNSEVGHGITVDGSGNIYLTGQTNSGNFPVTAGAFQTTCDGCQFFRYDVFVTKLNPTASALLYSTYVGGSIDDFGFAIAVDGLGNAYVTGEAESSNFDVTPGAFKTTGGVDAFVTKVNPGGTGLVYSTYLGGSVVDQGLAITADASGIAYVTGSTRSADFPTVVPLQVTHGGAGANDAFVTKLNATGSALLFSTFLGGLSTDSGLGIAVDAAGNIYVAGGTFSGNFPTASPLQAASGGSSDAFITKIAPSVVVNCTGTGSFRLTGRIRTSTGSGVPGVTLTLSGPGGCTSTTATDAFGVYAFMSLGSGVYTVTPGKVGCTFTPTSRTLTISGGKVQVSFAASCL